MPDVEANGGLLSSTTLHVDDTGGEGRPVVLIHGWPLSAASWSAQVPALQRAGYRVVAYDRRGFGRSDKPHGGYDYDTLAEDLRWIVTSLGLEDVTLVGFSMGGGEVARYIARYGVEQVRSVVFAAAIPPCLLRSDDNPDGPLTSELAAQMAAGLSADRDVFFDAFMTQFFSSGGEVVVTEAARQDAIAMCRQSDERAAEQCMEAFATTDFRGDLAFVTVPTLVLHGDADAVVPLAGSGARTHAAIAGSDLVVLAGAPHGCNVSHADEFNAALLSFLAT